MKQTNTLEMEIIRYLQTVTNKNLQYGATQSGGVPANQGDSFANSNDCLPGLHVMHNIMGYAKALQVLKGKSGTTMFLIGN